VGHEKDQIKINVHELIPYFTQKSIPPNLEIELNI